MFLHLLELRQLVVMRMLVILYFKSCKGLGILTVGSGSITLDGDNNLKCWNWYSDI